MPVKLLPIDISPQGTFLLSPEGRAVWPVQTGDELRALRRLAAVFASGLENLRGKPGHTPPGEECVVGLGESVEAPARLYAHLTNRRFRAAKDLGGLADDTLPAVVVTTPRWLNNELMEQLYVATPGRSAPGIICAPTLAALRRQVLLRAAATVLCGPIELPRVDVYPLLPISRLSANNQCILGGGAAASEMRDALGRGAGVLTVQTHADGVDAFLGPSMTLCPMDWNFIAADRNLSPLCQATGVCHRHDTPVEEALKSGTLLSPDGVSARVFVFNTCFGLLPPDGMVDPAWGFGPRLLDSATIGAVITTWEIAFTGAWHTETLSKDLLRGVTAGEALARFYRSPASRKFGRHRMCLLGDPSIRLPAEMQRTGPKRGRPNGLRVQIRDGQPTPLSDSGSEVQFLHACMTQLVAGGSGEILARAREALDAIRAYEGAAEGQRNVEGDDGAPGPSMRRAILRYVFSRGKLLEGWLPLVKNFVVAKTPAHCFICGRRTNTVIARLGLARASDRQLSSCPRCGVVEDVPRKLKLAFSLTAGDCVRLEGALPRRNWTAGILLGSPRTANNVGWEWPPAPDGAPAQTFRVPDAWPPGPLRVSFVLLWEENFAIVSRMARRPALDK